ncbi:60S ribosomal protein L28 [Geranomyces variabilis]|nr:60S ribosomal protein L28 [Geranomyces variabilis]
MSSEASPPAAAPPSGLRRPSQYEQCQEEIRQLHAQQKKKAHARERAPSAEVARSSGQAKKAKHTTAVAAESDIVAHAEEETGGNGVGDGDGAQRPVVRAGGASATTAPATSSSSPVPGTSSGGGGVQLMDDVEELGAPIDLRDRRGILKKMMERGHSQSLVEMFTLERSPGKEEVERMAQQLHLHPQEVWDFFEAMRATALAKWTREKKEAGEAAHVGTAFPPTSSRRSSHYGTTPSDRIPTVDRTSIPPSSSSAQSEAARRASFVQQAPRSIVMIDPYGRRPSLVLNPVIPGAQLMPGQLVYPGPAGTPGYIAAQVYYPQGTPPQSSHAATASHGEQKHARQQQKAQQQHGHRRPSTAPGGGGGNAGSYQAQHEKKQQQHTPTPTPVTPGGGHSSQQNYFQQPPLVYVPQYYLPPMGYQDLNQQQQRQQHKQQQQQQHQTRRPSTASRNSSFGVAGGGGPPPTMQPHHHPSTNPARSRAGSQAFTLNHFASSGAGVSGGASAPVPGTVSYVPTSATAATSGTAMHTSNGNSHYQHHSTTNPNSHHHHHPSASTTSRSSSSSAQQQHRAHDYYQPRTAAPAAMVIDPVLEQRRSAASVPTAATVAAAAAAARTRHVSAGHGRVGKHRKHPGGRGLAGGQHHHRINMDMYHPGYFGKVGMRQFHLTRQQHWAPVVNVDKLWTLVSEEARLKAEANPTGPVPVIDILQHGYAKLLGKGRLPNIPLIVKARFVSRKAEDKIVAAGGKVELVA